MNTEKNPQKQLKQISIRLPIEVHKALTIYCVGKDMKVGPFIQDLIEQVLVREGKLQPSEKRKSK